MNFPSTIHTTDLISVSEAANLVPYSRDHITRLAREGDIVATQTARRWMVSAVSLQRFYESSRHEDIVRQRYLSEARRRDLVIADQLRQERAQIPAAAGTTSVWYSATVVVSGLLCGVLLQASFSTWLMNTGSTPSTLVSRSTDAVTGNAQLAGVGVAVAASSNNNSNNRQVTSHTRELSLENGIVLLPMMASTTLHSEDFFSDDVDIEMLNETQGVVRLSKVPDAPVLTVLRLPGVSRPDVTSRSP